MLAMVPCVTWTTGRVLSSSDHQSGRVPVDPDDASGLELNALADMVLALRFKTILRTPVGDHPHWSFKFIDDLRYADEKLSGTST